MNLLLVDDDAYVTDAIKGTLDWKELGIQEVYSACSVSQAKKLIEEISIQIVICDIEMPKANGFELIAWIKEQKYLITYILLTSYAEFEYANKAIQLSSFAYALKPIDYEELQTIIGEAITKEKELLYSMECQETYQTWHETERNRKDFFFRSILLDKSIIQRGEIQKEIKRCGLSYGEDTMFFPMTFEFYDCEECKRRLGIRMFFWTVRNIMEELFSGPSTQLESFLTEGEGLGVVILTLQKTHIEKELFQNCEKLIEQMQKYIGGFWTITMGEPCGYCKVEEQVAKICCINESDVNREGRVLRAKDWVKKEIVYTEPVWGAWKRLIDEKQPEVLVEKVHSFLDNLVEQENLDRICLERFTMEFIQVYNTILRELGTYQLVDYADYHIDELKGNMGSVKFCKRYIQDIVRKTMWMASQNNEKLSVVEQVKKYVEEHMEEELNREFFAEMCYLNADYLARIFKKEVGESIGTYIVNRRMDMAKTYLSKTNEPVNVVAIKVGYDNFSYFSKVFKAEVGTSPKEFRKNEE